jgi:hypothetical protein
MEINIMYSILYTVCINSSIFYYIDGRYYSDSYELYDHIVKSGNIANEDSQIIQVYEINDNFKIITFYKINNEFYRKSNTRLSVLNPIDKYYSELINI